MRFAKWAWSAAILAVLGGTTAAEADGVCVSLEARLVQLERGNASGGDPHQYDGAIAQQQAQIEQATEQARDAGCTGGFLFFHRQVQPSCPRIMASLDKMQANLQRLEQVQAQLNPDPYAVASERSDVLRQLADNQCGPQYVAQQNESGFGGFIDSLFGNARMDTLDDQDQGAYSPYASAGGTYQTLCVRTCDGFYFPISFATVPSQFAADEATCQSMCPGGQAELYTHLNPGEDATQMVSLSGQPYTALPNAFRFQKEYDKSCTCGSASSVAIQGPVQNFSDFGTGGIQADETAAAEAAPAVPLPHLRPAAGEDPETIADRAGGFVPQPVTPGDANQSASASGQIRVVGPDYYYGQ